MKLTVASGEYSRSSERSAPLPVKRNRSALGVLIVSQLFAGVGVASGVAVGGLLAEQVSGTITMAGFAQTSSVLGAGIIAIPLARLASKRGRNWALATGYALALAGTLLVLLAAALQVFPLLLLGLGAFGAATASGLQSRFAATEVVSPAFQATAMSIVLWSTTIGSVAGPNLSQLGADLGASLGMQPLAGPYLFSLISFAGASLLIGLFLRTPPPGHLEGETADAETGAETGASATAAAGTDRTQREEPVPRAKPASVGFVAALREAAHNPQALFALMAITGSHMIMVGVMVMTPVHMNHHGLSLELVGLVISVHILGMYAASPIMGALADRIGARAVIFLGIAIFVVALTLGSGSGTEDTVGLAIALGVLGLGWSAGLIGGSALLTRSVSAETRVPLQGAADAIMNIAAAGAAAASGVILAWGGFFALNAIAAIVLIPMVALGLLALRAGAVARRAATG